VRGVPPRHGSGEPGGARCDWIAKPPAALVVAEGHRSGFESAVRADFNRSFVPSVPVIGGQAGVSVVSPDTHRSTSNLKLEVLR
jgi:hypothetical protein